MPGRVKSKDACDGEAPSKKPKAHPKKRGGRKMPPPLPTGQVLTDLAKGRWILGTSVGKGGFGEIYLASPEGSSVTQAAAKHVVKIEPHENGPLFTELSVYHRVAKPQSINDWVKKKGLRFLGVPKYVASGSHTHDSVQYRFMVMERYGNDLQKAFEEGGKKFSVKTICYLALRLLEALEYLHESEYVHADIKAANILVGHEVKHEVCLVDYGLAYRYSPEGVHKLYKEDPRRKHDGTIEFTSIDAHKGANPSRRGDLEILGYCLLQWACSQLPWEGYLEDKDRVAQQKMKYRDDVDGLISACFGAASPSLPCLKDYFQYVYKLSYEDKPDYEMLKGLFLRALKTIGQADDCTGLDWIAVAQGKKRKSPDVITSPFSKAKRRHVEEEVDAGDEVSQIKPTMAKGVRKQAVTKKRSSPKGRKHPSGETGEEETSPPNKVKVDTDSSDEKPQIKPIKPKAVRKRTAMKKASPPEIESDEVDGEQRGEEGVESVSPKELTEAKPIKRAAVSKKQTKSKPLPTTQPDKIPEVTYPVSLGYENKESSGCLEPKEEESSGCLEPKEEEMSRPKRSRRLNPTS